LHIEKLHDVQYARYDNGHQVVQYEMARMVENECLHDFGGETCAKGTAW